jgi:hypothetical protein
MKYLLPFFAIILFSTACNSTNNKDANAEKKYENTKESLEAIEKKSPKKFIAIEGDKRKNLIGQTVVKGKITNKAKIVTYKDVEMKISFYSKTKAVLEEDHETIYETIAPGTSVDFKSKFFTPKGSDSVGFEFVEAKM